jgi:hypothetical protein
VAATGTVAVASWQLVPPKGPDPSGPLKALSPGAFRILVAVADTMCPGAPGLPAARELHVAESVDTQLHRMARSDAEELAQALWVLESPVVGALLDQRLPRFTAGSHARRAAALDHWRRSPWPLRRKVYRAVAGLVNAAYWAHPATYPFVGYPGPPAFPEQQP